MLRAMTTSWDDGDPRDARVADLLDRYGLTGTFYIPRAAPNEVMPEDDVRRLAWRFEVGAHTLTHPRLTAIDDQQARDEIVGSKDWVEQVTGKPCTMFCPPEGKFTPAHRANAREAGYRGFRTVELLSLGAPADDGHGLAVLPTSVQAHPHKPAAYVRNALKRKSVGALARFALAGMPSDWPTLARRLLARTARRGGVFHLWGHSWEIDQHGQWAALESTLKTMAEYVSTLPPMTNAQLVAAR